MKVTDTNKNTQELLTNTIPSPLSAKIRAGEQFTIDAYLE
jgi:hypothetical protein